MTENKEKELTIKELEEKLRRKRLEEELAKKAQKQTRDFDESMLAVCQTCHVPIYVGEPLYNHIGEQVIGLYTGTGAFIGAYKGGVAAGTVSYSAHSGRSKTIEKWIQCGHCYAEFHKEREKLSNYYKRREKLEWASVILCLAPVVIFLLLYIKKHWEWIKGSGWLVILILVILFAYPLFYLGWISLWITKFPGIILYWVVKGGSPPEPDRYRIRKNPYREKLAWKLDNEGKPVKKDTH